MRAVRRPYANRPTTNSTLGPGITMMIKEARASAGETEIMDPTVGARRASYDGAF
jgi:hypothetical protein